MSNYFVVRGPSNYPQIFQIPTNWIPQEENWTETSLLQKDELLDMGPEFATEYVKLKNQISEAEQKLKELNKKVVRKAKRRKRK